MPTVYGIDSLGDQYPLLVDASGRVIVRSSVRYGGAYYKSPIPFGPSGGVARSWVNAILPAGNSNTDDTAVPADRIWVLMTVGFQYTGPTATKVAIQASIGGQVNSIYQILTPVSALFYLQVLSGLPLFPGDFLRVRVYGATYDDDIIAQAVGYYMLLEAE